MEQTLTRTDRPASMRGRAIADRLTAVRYADDPHTAYVTSSTGKLAYRVTRTSCTCPDHRFRGRTCKHMAYAAWLADNDRLPIVRRSA